MNESKSETLVFKNNGIVQVVDTGDLVEGQFYDLVNLTSSQAGSLEPRAGSRLVGSSLPGKINNIYKLRISSNDNLNPRYFSVGSSLYRSFPSSGDYSTFTAISGAFTLASERWGCSQFNIGESGLSHFYIAGGNENVRDNGSYSQVRRWGLFPPSFPVRAFRAYGEAVPIGYGSSGDVVVSDSCSSTALAISGTAGVYEVAPTGGPSTCAYITEGQLVKVGSYYTIADVVKDASFVCYLPAPGSTIDIYSSALTTSSSGSGSVSFVANAADVSLTGNINDSYDSDDYISFSIYVEAPASNLKDFSLKLYAGSGTSATGDYYEFSDTPELVNSENAWYRYKVKKTEFTKVGSAGTGTSNWSNIIGFGLDFTSISPASDVSIKLGGIAGVGGGGLNSTISGASPYRYVYTYRDPVTGHESNPSSEMRTDHWISAENRGVNVILTGFTSTAEYAGLAEKNSIAIYRAGGNFGDANYRLVGYADNPGDAASKVFVDNVPDDNIVSARIVEFDNYAPVYSSLKIPLSGKLSGNFSAGDHTGSAITFTDLPTGFSDFLSPGTEIIVGTGGSAETCIVRYPSDPGTAKVYLQFDHEAGEQVSCEAIAGQACKYVCQAYDSLFLAGDPNNPHILYKSKPGKPESFPVIVEATGVSNQLVVGSPGNPIMNITEINGEIISLNANNIYRIPVYNNAMQAPNETPAQRGVVSSFAWAKGSNALYYVAYDGVYAWQGGVAEKVSKQIDWVFRDRTLNGIPPINKANYDDIVCEYHQDILYVHYIGTDGSTYVLQYDTQGDKWSRHTIVNGSSIPVSVSSMYVERDTGTFLMGVTDGSTYNLLKNVAYGTVGQSDSFPTDDGVGGYPIRFSATTGFYTFGDTSVQKLFTDFIIEYELFDHVSNALTVDIYYNGSYTSAQTLAVAAVTGRQRMAIPLNSGNGQEAYSVAFKFSGTYKASSLKICSMTFNYVPLTQIQRGKITDWSDLGHPYDKKLQTFTIEYDAKGQSIDLYLDTLSGLDGNTQSLAANTFTISGNRGKKTFPITGTVICKMARIRPSVPANAFLTFSYDFDKIAYPADSVYSTDYKDGGNPYEKYFEQIPLIVDTGGVSATIQLDIDGTTQATAYTVTSTERDRARVLTLAPAIKGRRLKLLITPGTGGKFQLWDWDVITSPADKGPVFHTTDWDNLGSLYDKRLQTVTFEYEVTADTTMDMYMTKGISGSTQTVIGPYSFSLKAGGRKHETFPIPESVLGYTPVCKMVRFQPSATNVTFKSWKYDFQKIVYPPDTVFFTESKDGGSPYEKYFEQLALEVDTGGIQATIQLEVDGIIKSPSYTLTTTENTRSKVLTLSPAIKGRRIRLLITPGSGGKFQLWNWDAVAAKADKGPVFHSDDWDNLGHPYDKKLQTVTFEYEVTEITTMRMYLLVGITGPYQQQIGPILFTLFPGSRKHETFPIPETYGISNTSTICKMVRFEPEATNVDFKAWRYTFTKSDYPPDNILFTEWDDLDYKCEKICRSVTMDVDTGGVAATFYVQYSDQTGTIYNTPTYTINTTTNNRVRTFSFEPNIIGYKFRIIPTSGNLGKFQLFDRPMFERTLEPCPMTYWDSQEVFSGMAGYRIFKQLWIQYRCAGTITVKIYRDNNQLLYSKTLPAQTYRDGQRFYVPISSNQGSYVAINKSSRYRITIESNDDTKPFYLYRDESRMEVLNQSENQRAGYFQTTLFSQLPLPK